MLRNLLRSKSKSNQSSGPTLEYALLTSSLPSYLSYFRSDTVATYRDNTPKWIKSAANNEPRYDHNDEGAALGILQEPSRTNKNTQRNFAPTDNSGLTVISGTANITAPDYSPISTAKIWNTPISGLTNGKAIKIENTGVGDAVIQISATAGNTNPHSYRVLLAAAVGGSLTHATVDLSSGVGSVPFAPASADEFAEITQANLTVGSSGVYLRLTIPTGRTIYLLGTQFEEGRTVTSPIVTSGSAATRAHARIVCTDITTIPKWNLSKGALVAEIMPYVDDSQDIVSDEYMVSAGDGTSLNHSFALYAIQPRYKGRGRAASANTNYISTDVNGGYVKNKLYPIGITWVNGGQGKVFVGAGVFLDFTMLASASGITRLYLGGRDTANTIHGHVKSIRVYNTNLSLSRMMKGVIDNNDNAIAFAGQSNSVGYFSQQSTSTNGGERAMQPILDSIWDTGTRNWLINGGTNGSSIAQWTGIGSAITRFKEIIGAYLDNKGIIKAIVWDQGEANNGDSIPSLKAGWLNIFNDIRSYIVSKGGLSDIPIIIIPIGRRTSSDQNYNDLRRAQIELATENNWIHLAPEKWVSSLDADGIHLNDAGYIINGPHVVRKALKVLGETVLGGVDGPSITNVSRIGVTVTVTITHDGGTDFTPATGIEGFTFVNNGSVIHITAAVKTNATTITLTLQSTPSAGTNELYYGYRSLFGVNVSNLVVDNESTYPKVLKAYYSEVT